MLRKGLAGMAAKSSSAIASTVWNPSLYSQFSGPRLQPPIDLLQRVLYATASHQVRNVYDMGCGSGNVTKVLSNAFPNATVIGIDSSSEMIDAAKSTAGELEMSKDPLSFECRDLRNFSFDNGPPDVIFSSAALHWVPDHLPILLQWVASVAPGGVVALTVPLSFDLPSHVAMRYVLHEGGPQGVGFGTEELRATVRRRWVEAPLDYLRALRTCPDLDIVDLWSTRYYHELSGTDAVLNWVSSTGLRPILQSLPDAEREAYLSIYTAELRRLYPADERGVTVYPFERLFIVARKKN